MKRILLLIFLFFLLVFQVQDARCATEIEKYQEIYEQQQMPDFEYIFGIDPFQAEEYMKYTMAPYPLLRTGVAFKLENILIPPGYYLLTPREKKGKEYVLFKDSGKVKYIVPVYKSGLVDPLFYEQHVPTVKKGKWQEVCDWTNRQIGKIAKKSMRTEPPKSYIDVNDIGNTFWEVILFYGPKQYHMLFKQEGK